MGLLVARHTGMIVRNKLASWSTMPQVREASGLAVIL